MDIDTVSLGKRLRSIRQKKNMTIEELAMKADLSFALVAKIERGEKKGSIESLVAISNALEVSIEDLLEDSLLFTHGESPSLSVDSLVYLSLDSIEKETKVLIENVETLKALLKKNTE